MSPVRKFMERQYYIINTAVMVSPHKALSDFNFLTG